MLTLADVLKGLSEYRDLPGFRLADRAVGPVVIDSRLAEPASLFIALPGERVDGHDFVDSAFKNGAAVAIVDRVPDLEASQAKVLDIEAWQQSGSPEPPAIDGGLEGLELPLCLKVRNGLEGLQQLASYWRAALDPRVVAITGSVGKSTTKELIWAVLRRKFRTLKNPGNLNNEIGLPLTLLEMGPSHQRVVLEMGMYDLGEIRQLCQIARPDVGVVTNVGPTHLERLGTIECIAQAKAELVEALPAGGVAILNLDDPLVSQMADRVQPGVQVFSYGLTPEATLWADEVVSEGLEGVRFIIYYQGEAVHVKVPLLGRHSVHTALRATAVGLVEGMGWEDILSGLVDSAVQLRLVSVQGINGSMLLDDTYNASPASTIAALNLLDDLPGSRENSTSGHKIAVLGDMAELGEYEMEGHRKVGCRAADVVNLLVTVGPRARMIAEEARICGLAADAIFEVGTNAEAVEYLRNLVRSGDVVLVKGSRSMAMEEIVASLQDVGVGQPENEMAL